MLATGRVSAHPAPAAAFGFAPLTFAFGVLAGAGAETPFVITAEGGAARCGGAGLCGIVVVVVRLRLRQLGRDLHGFLSSSSSSVVVSLAGDDNRVFVHLTRDRHNFDAAVDLAGNFHALIERPRIEDANLLITLAARVRVRAMVAQEKPEKQQRRHFR